MSSEVQIHFAGATAAEANMLASSLADAISDTDPAVEIHPVRTRADSQDFGTALALVLGTAAAEAVARGISAWIARNSGAKIEFRKDGKTVLTATNINSADASRILQAIRETHR